MNLKGKVAIVTGGNSGIGTGHCAGTGASRAPISLSIMSRIPMRPRRWSKQVSRAWRSGYRGESRRQQGRRVAKPLRHRASKNSVGWTSWLTTPASRRGHPFSIRPKSNMKKCSRSISRARSLATQLAAKQMIKQGDGGRIINITSVHEDWPMPGNTAYCLSKGGMRMFTRTAGVELAPHNILVVGVGPGAVATPINLSTMNDPALLKSWTMRFRWAGWPDRRKSPVWSRFSRRWSQLHHGDNYLYRRRHHAGQSRALTAL